MATGPPVLGIGLDRAIGGYWLVASYGGGVRLQHSVLGSTGNVPLNQPVIVTSRLGFSCGQ